MAYCAPQTLTDINTECGASMGGVRIATVRNRADVESITVVDGEVTAMTLAESAAEDAAVLAFRDQTCQLSSEGTIDDVQGVHFYTHTLAFRFPRMSASKRMSIHALTHAETIAVVKDNNGVYWLVGNEAPLRASAVTAGTGTAFTDPNEYVPTLSCVSPELLCTVSAAALETFLGGATL